jgi:hypothetical protein
VLGDDGILVISSPNRRLQRRRRRRNHFHVRELDRAELAALAPAFPRQAGMRCASSRSVLGR